MHMEVGSNRLINADETYTRPSQTNMCKQPTVGSNFSTPTGRIFYLVSLNMYMLMQVHDVGFITPLKSHNDLLPTSSVTARPASMHKFNAKRNYRMAMTLQIAFIG
ncbi:hypothetical protein V6N13_140619 [Hibiscus sabdariffa]